MYAVCIRYLNAANGRECQSFVVDMEDAARYTAMLQRHGHTVISVTESPDGY